MTFTWVDGPFGGTPVTAANLNAAMGVSDAAIATQINNGASATAAALNATYVRLGNAFINAAQSYGVKADGSTDDSTAIQNAINAASTAGGGTVLLPAGTMIAKNLVPKSGVTLLGHDRNLTKLRTTTAGQDLFVSAASTNGCVFQGLSMQSVGGGNCFSGILYQSVFRDCGFFQNVDAKCVFDVTGWIDNLIQNCDFNHNLTATVPVFRAISATADIAAFTFDSSRFTNTGNYAIWLEGTLGAFCHNPTIRNCTFEVANGGAINLLSTKNARIDTCGVHDLSATTTKNLLNIDKSTSSGGQWPQTTIVTGWTRDSAATALGGGLYDINANGSDLTIIGANRYPAGSLAINLNSWPAIVLGGEATLTQGDYAVLLHGSVVRPGAVSTGGRPSATGITGSMFYDTTLGLPIWAIGSSWWDASGYATQIATKTANYTHVEGDKTVVYNGTSLTATLPDPTTVSVGKVYRVKNINASALTVNSAGTSKTLDGAASQSLAQWAKAAYVSDGAQWLTV